MRPCPIALLVIAAALPACTVSKETRCERFAETGLSLVIGIANGVADGLADGADVPDVELSRADHALAKKKAVEECMSWSDELVRCMTDGDFDSPACQEAYAAHEGVVVAVPGAIGPAPLQRRFAKYSALMCGAGRCFVAQEESVATPDGQEVARGDYVGVAVVAGKPQLLAVKDAELSLVGATVTPIAGVRPSPDESFATPLAVSPKGLVLFDDGRVRRLVAPPCERCFEETPLQIAGSDVTSLRGSELHELPDGGIVYYGDGSDLHIYGADGTKRLELRARDAIGEPLVIGNDIYVGADKFALRLDAARCASDARTPPHELSAPCLSQRITLAETPWERPVSLGGAVYLLVDGRVRQLVGDQQGWAAETEADSLLGFEHDGRAWLFAAQHWTMDHPGRLLVIDPASGKNLVQSDIPSTEKYSDFELKRHGDQLLVMVSSELFTFDIAALVGAARD